jgi:plastocyanin
VPAYEDEIPTRATYFASSGFCSRGAADKGVRDKIIEAGGSYQHTFDIAGTYEYFCIPHEGAGMIGTVEVG